MPVCDVCNSPLEFNQGYALTTNQVTTSVNYWKYMLNHHHFDDELLLMYLQNQALQRSGWLVCESCSQLFAFDRQQARRYAEKAMDPPGSGPAEQAAVIRAAALAWQEKYERLPNWIA